MTIMIAVELAFWTCVAAIAYAYAVYPLLVWVLARLFGQAPAPGAYTDNELPTVSLLIAAHNEEKVIARRIANALALDYPADRLEIVIASDGSSDTTARIVSSVGDPRIRLLESPRRRGKATVLNAAFRSVRGQIVLLSDANTFTDASAVRQIVRWFQNPRIGIVCGRLVLTDPATGRNVDSLYWRYETFLKRCEGRLGALLGANGAIYAIRASMFTGIRNDTIVDDFVIPLITRLRSDCAIVYDDTAVAYEETPHDLSAEFGRRSRIGAGGFQSIVRLVSLLIPRNGWVAFTFFSHKVLRWLCPFLMIGALVTNLALIDTPLYQLTMALQLVGYGMSLAGLATGTHSSFRSLRLATMFTTMNAALLVGFWRWASGGQRGVWQRTAR
jgi:cellulose synthase/poly-beta-1,6-N-acetylglucosamine synthase-like glycosyltransferase